MQRRFRETQTVSYFHRMVPSAEFPSSGVKKIFVILYTGLPGNSATATIIMFPVALA